MNDTTDNNTEASGDGLQGAFGDRGTNVNSVAYGHPHTEQIMSEARDILSQTTSGKKLLKVLDQRKVPLQIMKGKGESGFSPEMMSIVIMAPGATKNATGELVISLIRALREAAQELGGFKTPDPRVDVVKYAEFVHARNLDSVKEVLKIGKELTDLPFYTIFLDSLTKLGLNGMYKAYLEGASQEELFEEYAKAYNNFYRGSF